MLSYKYCPMNEVNWIENLSILQHSLVKNKLLMKKGSYLFAHDKSMLAYKSCTNKMELNGMKAPFYSAAFTYKNELLMEYSSYLCS